MPIPTLIVKNFNVNEFIKKAIPIEKMVAAAVNKASGKLENAVLGSVSDLFAKAGIGSKSARGLLSNLGDAVLQQAASEFFGFLSTDVFKFTKDQIVTATGNALVIDDPAAINAINKEIIKNKDVLQYPPDLDTHYFKIQFNKYDRPNPSETATFNDTGAVILPLPRTLEETHDVSYQASDTGIAGTLSNNAGDLSLMGGAKAGLAYFAEQNLSDNIFTVGSQELFGGVIPNPNVTAAFRGINLRKHRFNWLLAPNNKAESDTIRDIIKKLKRSALPSFVSDMGTTALKYPNICTVKIYPWAGKPETSHLFNFKSCVIESINVNYAPETLAFFNGDDSPPSFIGLSISLLEIEYFTATDFGGANSALTFNTPELLGKVVGLVEDSVKTAVTAAIEFGIVDAATTPGPATRKEGD